jgi:hypothetical protein
MTNPVLMAKVLQIPKVILAKVTRIGLLGQMAFAKIFNQPMDFEYREKGDKYDNKIGSWTYDINAMRN